jgi:hypothetical protein
MPPTKANKRTVRKQHIAIPYGEDTGLQPQVGDLVVVTEGEQQGRVGLIEGLHLHRTGQVATTWLLQAGCDAQEGTARGFGAVSPPIW